MASHQTITITTQCLGITRNDSTTCHGATISRSKDTSSTGSNRPSHTWRHEIPENNKLPPPGPISSPDASRTSSLQTINFNELLESITATLQQPSPSLADLKLLLEKYISDSSDWIAFAHPDPNKQYTRNLVCEMPGLFNLLLLVWTPGKASPIHDHADSHCLMKVLKGCLREKKYKFPESPEPKAPLIQTSDLRFGMNKVSYMSDQLGIHEISNANSKDYAVSLHLYFPPNAAIRGCSIFDLQDGKATRVRQGPYHSVYGVTVEQP